MNNVIKGYQPFCAGCDNLQSDGKLPLKCDNCPKHMKNIQHEVELNELKTKNKAILRTNEYYRKKFTEILDKYRNLLKKSKI